MTDRCVLNHYRWHHRETRVSHELKIQWWDWQEQIVSALTNETTLGQDRNWQIVDERDLSPSFEGSLNTLKDNSASTPTQARIFDNAFIEYAIAHCRSTTIGQLRQLFGRFLYESSFPTHDDHPAIQHVTSDVLFRLVACMHPPLNIKPVYQQARIFDWLFSLETLVWWEVEDGDSMRRWLQQNYATTPKECFESSTFKMALREVMMNELKCKGPTSQVLDTNVKSWQMAFSKFFDGKSKRFYADDIGFYARCNKLDLCFLFNCMYTPSRYIEYVTFNPNGSDGASPQFKTLPRAIVKNQYCSNDNTYREKQEVVNGIPTHTDRMDTQTSADGVTANEDGNPEEEVEVDTDTDDGMDETPFIKDMPLFNNIGCGAMKWTVNGMERDFQPESPAFAFYSGPIRVNTVDSDGTTAAVPVPHTDKTLESSVGTIILSSPTSGVRLLSNMMYCGQWSDGLWHGYGRLSFLYAQRNYVYEGYFERGSFSGQGDLTFEEDSFCITLHALWDNGEPMGYREDLATTPQFYHVTSKPNSSTVNDWDMFMRTSGMDKLVLINGFDFGTLALTTFEEVVMREYNDYLTSIIDRLQRMGSMTWAIPASHEQQDLQNDFVLYVASKWKRSMPETTYTPNWALNVRAMHVHKIEEEDRVVAFRTMLHSLPKSDTKLPNHQFNVEHVFELYNPVQDIRFHERRLLGDSVTMRACNALTSSNPDDSDVYTNTRTLTNNLIKDANKELYKQMFDSSSVPRAYSQPNFDANERYLFHGVSNADAAFMLLATQFRKRPPAEITTGRALFGKGYYFSDNINKSLEYAGAFSKSVGSNVDFHSYFGLDDDIISIVFGCRVALGCSIVMQDDRPGTTWNDLVSQIRDYHNKDPNPQPPTFKSADTIQRNVFKTTVVDQLSDGFDSLCVVDLKDTRYNANRRYNEFIVFDSSRILPVHMFVIRKNKNPVVPASPSQWNKVAA